MVKAGIFWNTLLFSAAVLYINAASAAEVQWNGQWLTTVPGQVSVCGTTAGVDIETGPIWNNVDAQSKCSNAIAEYNQAEGSKNLKYVAMGSSYAAAPGVGERDDASGACARSSTNYPRLLAAQRNLQLVDVTCSGATTDDVFSRAQLGLFPPQIEAITAETGLVTLTIGGNDVNYIGNLMGRSCLAEQQLSGVRKNCSILAPEEVSRRFSMLPSKLTTIINEIKRRAAPLAKIVIVGYLPVLPYGAMCAAVPLLSEDVNRMRAMYNHLETTLMRAASDNNVLFVASGRLGMNHDACSENPYTTGFHPAVSAGWSFSAPYHPNQLGMQAIAHAIDALLSRH